jgi:hypothetical protein
MVLHLSYEKGPESALKEKKGRRWNKEKSPLTLAEID